MGMAVSVVMADGDDLLPSVVCVGKLMNNGSMSMMVVMVSSTVSSSVSSTVYSSMSSSMSLANAKASSDLRDGKRNNKWDYWVFPDEFGRLLHDNLGDEMMFVNVSLCYEHSHRNQSHDG